VRIAALVAGLAVAALATAVEADPLRFIPWREADTPALALKDLAGRPHALPDYGGQVVLINFWATWCEPCRDEMPSLQRLKERLASLPVTVLAVNYGESSPKVVEFVRRFGFDLPVLLDPGQQAARAWRVRLLPTSYLVDAEGRVRYSVVGELDWATDAVVSMVRRLATVGGGDRRGLRLPRPRGWG
jgi:thiol-disulfide isomerase/thioredoxin